MFNDSQREVLISGIDEQPATLGRYFLTAAYLMVDQDSDRFTLWQANPSTNSRLVPIPSASIESDCTNTTAPDSSSSSTTTASPKHVSPGVIAGPVVAVVVILIIAALIFFIRRTRKSQGTGTERVARTTSPGLLKHELPSETSNPVVSPLAQYSGKSGTSELSATPVAGQQIGKSSGPIYELSSGVHSPLLPRSQSST